MVAAFVASTNANLVGASTQTSGTKDYTGVSLIVFSSSGAGQDCTPTADSSADNGSNYGANTFTDLTTAGSAGAGVLAKIKYAKNPTVSSTMVFKATYTAQFLFSEFSGYSGIDTTAPFDVESQANNSSGTPQPGSTTPTDGDLLYVHYGLETAGDTTAIDSGFTILDHSGLQGGVCYAGSCGYAVHTTGAINPSATVTGGGRYAATIASFLAAAGGGGGGNILRHPGMAGGMGMHGGIPGHPGYSGGLN